MIGLGGPAAPSGARTLDVLHGSAARDALTNAPPNAASVDVATPRSSGQGFLSGSTAISDVRSQAGLGEPHLRGSADRLAEWGPARTPPHSPACSSHDPGCGPCRDSPARRDGSAPTGLKR